MTRPTLVVALALASGAAAQLVSPAGLGAQEGNSANNYPFYGTMHYMQLHGDVRGPATTIRGQSHRRGMSDSRQVARTLEVEIWMGEGDLATASATFANNYQTPRTQVFTRKNVSAPSWTTFAGSPPPFDLTFAYDVPFPYSGTRDLVWEMAVTQNSANQQTYSTDAHQQYIDCGPERALGVGCLATGQTQPMTLLGSHCSNARTARVGISWYLFYGARSAPGAFLIGLVNPALPLPGMCAPTLYTDAAVTVSASTDSGGSMEVPFAEVSFYPRLAGLKTYAQAATLDAAQPGLPLAVSNGMEVTVVAPPTLGRYARIHGGLGNASGGLEHGYALVTRFNP